jgi:pyrimidine operon attenuation protein/uracil phosphoribosyltransferase
MQAEQPPAVIGILTGGAWIAEHLHKQLQRENIPLGLLNIAFYRDDFTQIGLHPQVTPSELPFTVNDRHIILVDDVLHTGRTIRAAMNEIFDYGRPASITLVTLLDRGHRELPISCDFVGSLVNLPSNKYVKLTGPDPLTLITVSK